MKILIICYGGSELAVSVTKKLSLTFLTIFLISSNVVANNHEDVSSFVKQIEDNSQNYINKYQQDIENIQVNVKSNKRSGDFEHYKSWAQNQNEIHLQNELNFRPEIKPLQNSRSANSYKFTKLLGSYKMKPKDVKKSSRREKDLMIFVSSSMPPNSFKSLMIQARSLGIPLIMRGFIKDLSHTRKFLYEMAKEDVSIIIDPTLFKKYNVSIVPSFIILKDGNLECEKNECKYTPLHDRISGNVSLGYVLETIRDGNGNSVQTASKYLRKLEQGGSI